MLDKEKAIATLQMLLSITQNSIEQHEEVAMAVSFKIIFDRFATVY